jgi:hypothetical protein
MPDVTRESDARAVRERKGSTDATSDLPLERAKVREVAGVLPSRAALDASVESLLLAGFDRADIDVMDGLAPAPEKLGTADLAPEDLIDVARAPRRPYIGLDDVITTEVVVTAVLASIGGIAAAFVVVSSGGGFGSALIVAAGAALIAGGVGFLLMMLLFRQRVGEAQSLEALTASDGFVLWVRVRTPEQEDTAKHILKGYGGRAVRLHEIEIATRQEDIPLSSLRPDPWLGDERLGDP